MSSRNMTKSSNISKLCLFDVTKLQLSLIAHTLTTQLNSTIAVLSVAQLSGSLFSNFDTI